MALRILSYNILAGGQDRLPLIARVIQKQQPYVVALLEARNRSHAEALAEQLGKSLKFGEANNIYQDHVHRSVAPGRHVIVWLETSLSGTPH